MTHIHDRQQLFFGDDGGEFIGTGRRKQAPRNEVDADNQWPEQQHTEIKRPGDDFGSGGRIAQGYRFGERFGKQNHAERQR